MKVEEFFKNKQRETDYIRWINSDMTLMVCGMLREHFLRPLQPGALGQLLNENSAAYCLGETSGAWKIFDAIRNLNRINEQPIEMPEETYEPPKQSERETEGE